MTKRMKFCCADCFGTLWTASIVKTDNHPISGIVLTLMCEDCKGEADFYIHELPEGHILSEGNA